MSPKSSRFVVILLILAASLLLAGGIVLDRLLLPRLIDPEKLKGEIESAIFEHTGARAEIESLSVHPTLFHGVLATLDNSSLYDPEGTRMIQAGQVQVNIRYLPLLFGKSSLSSVSLNDVEVYIGEQSFLIHLLRKQRAPSEKLAFENTRIALNHYRIIADRYFDRVSKYRLEGERLLLSHFRSNRALRFYGSGEGYWGISSPDQRIARFVLDSQAGQNLLKESRWSWENLHNLHLQLHEIDLAALHMLSGNYPMPVAAQGSIDFLSMDLHDGVRMSKSLAVEGRIRKPVILYPPDGHAFHVKPGTFSFQTKIRFPKSGQPIIAALDNLQLHLKGPTFSLDSEGEIELRKRLHQSTLHLIVKANDMPASLLQLIPTWSEEQRSLLKTIHGRIAVNTRILGSFSKPRADGTLGISELEIRSPAGRGLLVKNLGGMLSMQPSQEVDIREFKGIVADSPFMLEGTLNLKTGAITQGAIRAESLNLAKFHQLLQPFAPEANHPLRRIALEGKAGIDLKMNGSLKNPLFVGRADIRQVRIADKVTQVEISNVAGGLDFDESTIRFRQLMGKLSGIPFELSGRISDRYQKLELAVASSNSDLSAVYQLLQRLSPNLAKDISLAGRADFNLKLGGTVQKPVIAGAIQLLQSRMTYLPKALSFEDAVGTLNLTPEAIALEGIQGRLNAIPVTLKGTMDTRLTSYHIGLTAQQVPVGLLQESLIRIEPALKSHFQAASIRSGTADLDLAFSSALPTGLGGMVSLQNVYATPSQLDTPIQLSQVRYDLETGRLQFPSGGVQIGALRFKMDGFTSATGYELHLRSQSIPIAFLQEEKAFIERITSLKLPNFYNTQGSFQLETLLSPQAKEMTLRFQNAGASMEELKYPLHNINGTMNLSLSKTFKAYVDKMSFRYANSPVSFSFDANGLQDIYLEATGTMAPLLVNDFLLAQSSRLIAYAAVPFDINLSGSLGSLDGAGRGNNLNMFFNFNIASLFSSPGMEKPAEAGDDSLNQANLSSVLHLVGNTLKVEQTRFRVSEESSVLLEGEIRELFSPQNRQLTLSLVTEPTFDLAAWERQFGQNIAEGLAGHIRANLKLVSAGETSPSLYGNLAFDRVRSSSLEIEDLHGDVRFTGSKAEMNIEHFQIPGVDVGFTALLSDLFRYPTPIADFDLTGRQFIVSLYTEWINRIMIGRLRKGLWEQFFPSTGRQMSLPFEITNGTLQLTEGIINNLIVQDYTSNIRLYPNTYFELDNARAKSAGGNVSGYFAMNPRDNYFMTVHLIIDKMKANAVSRILLNVSNQIFGDLSGIIDYTAEGATSEELLSNTNGSANLRIEDGRLPAIAKIENLLVAANTISGGLANLNLNSLFRLAAPFNTDYFARLTGKFKMMEGIIYTDDMRSDGQNLDFLMGGSIRMVDGFANVIVKGEMDREIGGVLGPLGRLSFGRFLGIFPPLRKVISFVPGIGFIPGFGGPRSEKGVAFEVKIEGLVLDPGSVQDFKWSQ